MGKPKEFATAKWFLTQHAELFPKGTRAENGTPEQDSAHVADCWYIMPDGGRISLGVRTWHPLCKHRDFRVRAHREGRPIEAAALRAGERTYDIYINLWQPRDGEKVVEFVALDIHAMRKAGLLEFRIPPWREAPAWEHDGSRSMTESFYAISAERLLKDEFAIKSQFFSRSKESDFMEEILGKDCPRELLKK